MVVSFSTVWCLETVSAIEVPFSKYFHIRAPSRKWHPYVFLPAPAQCLRLLLLRASQSSRSLFRPFVPYFDVSRYGKCGRV